MPPAHKRNIDDSRSETSSSVPNHKDGKSHVGTTSGSGIPKTKRAANGSAAKAPVNASAGPPPAPAANSLPAVDKDPKLPRVCHKRVLINDPDGPRKADFGSSYSRQIGRRLPTACSAPTGQPTASTSPLLSSIRTPTSYTTRHEQPFEPHRQSLLAADFAKRSTEDGNMTMPDNTSTAFQPPRRSARPRTTLATAIRTRQSQKNRTQIHPAQQGPQSHSRSSPRTRRKAATRRRRRLSLSLTRHPPHPPPRPRMPVHVSRRLSWPSPCANISMHSSSAKPTRSRVSHM